LFAMGGDRVRGAWRFEHAGAVPGEALGNLPAAASTTRPVPHTWDKLERKAEMTLWGRDALDGWNARCR